MWNALKQLKTLYRGSSSRQIETLLEDTIEEFENTSFDIPSKYSQGYGNCWAIVGQELFTDFLTFFYKGDMKSVEKLIEKTSEEGVLFELIYLTDYNNITKVSLFLDPEQKILLGYGTNATKGYVLSTNHKKNLEEELSKLSEITLDAPLLYSLKKRLENILENPLEIKNVRVKNSFVIDEDDNVYEDALISNVLFLKTQVGGYWNLYFKSMHDLSIRIVPTLSSVNVVAHLIEINEDVIETCINNTYFVSFVFQVTNHVFYIRVVKNSDHTVKFYLKDTFVQEINVFTEVSKLVDYLKLYNTINNFDSLFLFYAIYYSSTIPESSKNNIKKRKLRVSNEDYEQMKQEDVHYKTNFGDFVERCDSTLSMKEGEPLEYKH